MSHLGVCVCVCPCVCVCVYTGAGSAGGHDGAFKLGDLGVKKTAVTPMAESPIKTPNKENKGSAVVQIKVRVTHACLAAARGRTCDPSVHGGRSMGRGPGTVGPRTRMDVYWYP